MGTHNNEWMRDQRVDGLQSRDVGRLLYQLGVVLASLSAVSAVLWAIEEDASAGPWLWISPVILFVSCTGTAFRIIRSDYLTVASPVSWVLLAGGVYWGFGPLSYTFGEWSTIEEMNAGYYVGPSELLVTNLLNSVGMLAVVAGLVAGRRLVSDRPHGWVRRLEGMDAMQVAGVLAAVGLTSKFTMVLPRMFGMTETQSSTLLQLEVFTKGALMILSYYSVTRGGKATFWLVILFAIEFVTASLCKSKLVILEVVIAVLIGRTLAVRKASTVVKGFAAMGLSLLVLQPVVSASRMMGMGRSTGGDYASLAMETGSMMVQSISELIDGSNAAQEMSAQAWWSRLCYAPQQAFAMQEYDSGRPGSPWADFAMGLIPRLLWPDKPLVTPGVNFSILFNGNADNCNGPGVLGEGYWYGGWPGLLVVGLYTGMFLGGIDRISKEVISRRAWIVMPLVFVGVKTGFRIDGWFSTEFMFGSVWYVLLAMSIFYSSTFYLTWAKRNQGLPSH